MDDNPLVLPRGKSKCWISAGPNFKKIEKSPCNPEWIWYPKQALIEARNKNWRVGETVNSYAFHAYIHGFESRTRHHLKSLGRLHDLPFFFISLFWTQVIRSMRSALRFLLTDG